MPLSGRRLGTCLLLWPLQKSSRALRGEEEYPISIETSVLPLNSSGFLLKSWLPFVLLQKGIIIVSLPVSLLAPSLFRHNGVSLRREAIISLLRQWGLAVTSAGWQGGLAALQCLPWKASSVRRNTAISHQNTLSRQMGAKLLKLGDLCLWVSLFPPQMRKNKEFHGIWII